MATRCAESVIIDERIESTFARVVFESTANERKR